MLVEYDRNNNLVNDPLSPLLIKLIESCANGKSIESLNHFVRMHSTQIFHSIKCVKLSMESVSISTRHLFQCRYPVAATLTHTTIYESISTMQSSITEHSRTTMVRVVPRRKREIIHPWLTTNTRNAHAWIRNLV